MIRLKAARYAGSGKKRTQEKTIVSRLKAAQHAGLGKIAYLRGGVYYD